MTPGQAELIEAMRLEQARIYGQLQREHHAVDDEVVCTRRLDRPPPAPSNVTRLAPPRKDVA